MKYNCLFQPKLSALEAEISRLSMDQLAVLKLNINGLFGECVATLDNTQQPAYTIRCVNALLVSRNYVINDGQKALMIYLTYF